MKNWIGLEKFENSQQNFSVIRILHGIKIPMLCPSIDDDVSRTIIHLDIDCFYAQVETILNPELATKPVGVQQKNLVITTNYVARKMVSGQKKL